MRPCQIRVQFESGVKNKFLKALNQLMASCFHYHCLPWSYSFLKMYDIYVFILGQKTVEV